MMKKKINSRDKGHAYERQIVSICKDLGYDEAGTSRNNNRALDALKVDLVNTDPFNIQAKAQENGINYFKLLDSMPQEDNHNIVLHKKNRQGDIAVMRTETLYHIIDLLKKNNLI